MDWYGCYSEGWQNEIVPEAFSHPAKFSRALIRRIYAHALKCGYLREGDVVVDPFDGVALGALDAMFHGLHHIGCELEEKFVQLGQQNIDLWNRRYGNGKLRRWGTAAILQGDSRNLVEVLEGARAEGIIASPPFADTHSVVGVEAHARQVTAERVKTKIRYGTDPAQLGNMPTGEPPQAVIASPPYANRRPEASGSGVNLEKQYQIYQAQGGGASFEKFCRTQKLHSQDYGASDGQLAAMREGDVDAVIASPPYAGSHVGAEDNPYIDVPGGRLGNAKTGHLVGNDNYGDTDGQLATLPEGEPPAGIVSSPPWYGTTPESGDPDYAHKFHGDQSKYAESTTSLYNELTYMSPEWIERRKQEAKRQGNISRLPAEAVDPDYPTFWSAACAILLQCHAVLAPGGHAIWVLKAFVRNKTIVDFPGQWEALCNSCGFETIEVIRAWLVEERGTQYDLMGEGHTKVVERKSFFRRLYEFKARAAKFWESVTRDDKAGYLWHTHGEIWRIYHEQMLDDTRESSPPLPTRTRILSAAQALVYRESGEPDVEIDTQIDYEVVLVMRKEGRRLDVMSTPI